jgi:Holliday junction resolvasome RuvABC endonuclease subunit
MITIACDPSSKYLAFAVYNDKQLTIFTKITASFSVANTFFAKFANEDFAFAVEDQYFSLNPKTLVRLVEVRSMLTTVALFYGASKILVIPPQKWQTQYLGVGLHSHRDQRKKASCMVASKITGCTIKDPDIADAVCIGDYALRLRSAYGQIYEESKRMNKKINKKGS